MAQYSRLAVLATAAFGIALTANAEAQPAKKKAAAAAACASFMDERALRGLAMVHSEELEPDDGTTGGVGLDVKATGGAASCSGSALTTGLTCQIAGPAVLSTLVQDYAMYRIPAGRSATYRYRKVRGGDQVSCTLNPPASAPAPR